MQGVLVAVGVTPSTAPSTGTCGPWASEANVCAPCTTETADLDRWLQVATDLLFELSGQRFPGLCTDIAHPCAQSCHGDGPRYYGDLVTASAWQWYGSCSCGSAVCGCTAFSELELSGWPLASVESVTIDGDILAEDAYEIHDWKRLVRVDGEQWPACSDDFEIEFTYGSAVPSPGVAAAAEWGCQFALGCAGDSACRLPQKVQTVTRQGVSMTILDPFQFLEEGLSGLGGIVDYFLTAYGPKSKNRWPALVVSPDLHSRSRRTTG